MPDRRGGPLRLLRRGRLLKFRGRLYMHRADGSGRFRRQGVVSLARVSDGCLQHRCRDWCGAANEREGGARTYGIKELAR